MDDIEQQRKIASEILKSLNYLVVTAASGEEAVAYLKSSSADLVLLDMIMDPGMDGLETYRRIIHDQPGQKAVIASGYAENIRVEEAIRLGVGKYIRKPYSIKNLGEVIKQVLASR
ncbi:MAG: response regulator [Deltaproteobacteria bacterium]|nr:response regulator [Deltaproteobacteria bacterium]